MYKVYGSVKSRTFRVLWALEEVGATYEFETAMPRSETVTALNPSGKVPVMTLADGTVLTDSTAIMTYIADAHGALTFASGTAERARQDAMTFRLLDELDSVLWSAAKHSFILPKDERVPEVKPSLKREFDRNVRALAEAYPGPFIMGEMMTLPDIVLTHCLDWSKNAGFPDLPDRFLAYLEAIHGRPAHQAVRSLAS